MTPATETPTPYTPVPDATELLRRYTSSDWTFRINGYATYLTTTTNVDPETKVRTARHIFPFAHRPGEIASEEARFAAHNAMTCRSIRAIQAIQKLPHTRADGDGMDQLEFAAEKIRGTLKERGLPTEGMRLVMNPAKACGIAPSMAHRFPRSDVKEMIDPTNPNRPYGLPSKLFGVKLVVENAVVPETSGKKRHYAWPSDTIALLYQDPTVREHPLDEITSNSTIQFRFLKYSGDVVDMLMVETMADANGYHGHIVEDYCVTVEHPELAFVLKW